MEKRQKTVRSLVNIYENAFLNSPDFAYLLDKHGLLLDCNLNFMRFLGISSIDKQGPEAVYQFMRSSTHWPEAKIQEIQALDSKVMSSEQPVFESHDFPLVDKNNVAHHYRISRIPLCFQQQTVMALLVIIKDMTDKTQLHYFNARANEPADFVTMLDKPLHMLIVEDNTIAQKAAQSILEQMGCTVDAANNEIEFLALFKPGKYVMVFMDIGLAETSGYMLAKNIRAQEKGTNHHVPIIALTGYQADMLTADCGFYQMEGAITKPLTLEQTRQLIQRYILNRDTTVTGLKLAEIPQSK